MQRVALALVLVVGCSSSATPSSTVAPAPTATAAPSTPPGSEAGALLPDAGAPVIVASYPIDLAGTSVSGLSSGAFMAVQFHVAFSSTLLGAAIFAGGPFYCAQDSLTYALTTCESASSAPDATPLIALTKTWATSGLIDDPSHLTGQHVFLFGGADDETVNPVVMDALNSYYEAFVGKTAIDYESRHPGTSHTMPTLSYGTSCDVSVSPWLGICNYDGAGKALAQIYGTLAAPSASPSGTYVAIPQGKYVTDPASHSLGDTAYLYVPKSCAGGETCRIHVVFHGCQQEASGTVGDAFYKHAGYNEWADTNHLLVLYPQTIASSASPTNPNACWDWWGYDSVSYAQKTGPQMAMVRAMIDGLAAGGSAGGDE